MYNIQKWTKEDILTVWDKGKIVSGNSPDIYRKDACGAWMQFNMHGDRDAQYGWEIDHILPVSRGGSDNLNNLQPLHWKNNAEKGDSSQLKCAVTN